MRRFSALCLFATFLFASPGSVLGQDVVGTAIVNGKKIQILENFTWQFDDRLADSCFVVTAGMDFCGKPAGWKRVVAKAPQITAKFVQDGRNYAFFISEAIGTEDGFTLDTLAAGVIENAANGMGVAPSDVPIFHSRESDFYGKRARTIAMQVKLQNVFFVFINTFWIEEKRSRQVFTYTYGDKLKESDWDLHKQVTGSLSFS